MTWKAYLKSQILELEQEAKTAEARIFWYVMRQKYTVMEQQ